MADQFDMASEHEQKATEIAQKYRKPEGPPAIGTCYQCGEEVREGHRWCNAECRDDFERATGRTARV